MQVFISWSQERSRAVAEILARWLAQVIQAAEPWISADIEKGARWGPEISSRLESSRVGIICLTPENLESAWILFEAGALSKTKDAYVCTFLLDLTPAGVEPPLAQFQHTQFAKEDVLKLVQTINTAVERSGEKALPSAVLLDVFETFWPQLENKISEILAMKPSIAPPRRSEADVLDEILSTVRSLEQRQAIVEMETSDPLRASGWTRPWTTRRRPSAYVLQSEPSLSEADAQILNYFVRLARKAKEEVSAADKGATEIRDV